MRSLLEKRHASCFSRLRRREEGECTYHIRLKKGLVFVIVKVGNESSS